MAKIKLNGDTSGYIEISAPAVSGNNTLELGPGTRILTNLDNTFTGVSTFSSDIYLGNDIYLTDGSSGYEKVEVGANDIRVESKHVHSEFGVWTRSSSLSDRRNGIDGNGNDLRLYSNSTEKVRITSAGNVGIGTDNPDATLKVNVASGNNGVVVQNTSTANIALFGARNGDATVQIGQWGSTASGSTFGLSNADLSFIYTTSYSTTHPSALALGTVSNKPIVFATNNTERLRITSAGDLGIGTNAPTTGNPSGAKFIHIHNSTTNTHSPAEIYFTNANTGSTGGSGGLITFFGSDFYFWNYANANLHFGTGGNERFRFDNSLNTLDFVSTSKIRLKGSYTTGQTHAHLNIGSDGSGVDTRAIDIWGSWGNQETKSITWNHGTGTSNIVCQQRVRYNQSPSYSVYEIGRLYHNQDTTAFPFQLESTGTSTANLTIDGQIYNRNQSFVAYSSQNDNIQSSTKIDYTVSSSYANVFDNTNSRFTAQRAGLYLFYVRHWFIAGSSGTVYLDMMKNGTSVKEFRVTHPTASTEYESIQGTALVPMAVNDYMEVNGSAAGGASLHESSGTRHSEFSGFYVSG